MHLVEEGVTTAPTRPSNHNKIKQRLFRNLPEGFQQFHRTISQDLRLGKTISKSPKKNCGIDGGVKASTNKHSI